MNKFEQMIRSRKFWAAVVSLAFALFGARAGLPQEVVYSAVVTLVGYILGVALEDGLKS